MKALQDSKKFGVDEKGKPVAHYVEKSAKTIEGIKKHNLKGEQ